MKKGDADELLTALATHAFRKGCSSDDTQNVNEVAPKGCEAVRNWILAALPNQASEFDCVIAIDSPEIAIQNAILAVCDDVNVKRSPHLPGLPDQKNVVFLRGKRSGLRPMDAIRGAEGRRSLYLNVLALFRQRPAPAIRHVA